MFAKNRKRSNNLFLQKNKKLSQFFFSRKSHEITTKHCEINPNTFFHHFYLKPNLHKILKKFGQKKFFEKNLNKLFAKNRKRSNNLFLQKNKKLTQFFFFSKCHEITRKHCEINPNMKNQPINTQNT